MSEYLHYLGLTALWVAACASSTLAFFSFMWGFNEDEWWVLTAVCLVVALLTWPLLATLGQLQ